MYIFGGILELTKELNEMLIYDFKSGKFAVVGMGEQDNKDNIDSQGRAAETGANELKVQRAKTLAGAPGQSPTKIGGNQFGSPTKSKASPSKLTSKARRAGKSPQKKTDGAAEVKDKKESGLASPTSITMQNSFIIKNADESFDAYYQQMRKRKLGQ